MSMSIMDWINMSLDPNKLTKQEFTFIRNNGSKEELEEALARMEQCGGYDNLIDEEE